MTAVYNLAVSLLQSVIAFVYAFVDKHKGMRRGMVIWACVQTTWVIHRVFSDMDKITANAISAMTLICVPLVSLIVYYVKLRSDNDGDEDKSPPPSTST